MALQAPVMNVAATTIDLWPSMKSTLAAPWRTLMKSKASPSKSPASRQASTLTSDNTPKAAAVEWKVSELPECLASVPTSSLRMPHFTNLHSGSISHVQILPISSKSLSSANPYPLKRWPTATRAYSTFTASKSSRNLPPLQPFTSRLPAFPQRRSVFGIGSSSQNLLAHMEQTANNNPSSATAQNAFYSALLRADMPAIVAERYQSGRYATNSATEATYQKALEKLAKTDGASGYGTGSMIQGRNNMSTEQLHALGQAVAAQTRGGQVAGPKPGSSGSGEKSNPLYVVVEESTGSSVFKWVKFLLYFGLFGYLSLVVITVAVETSGILKKVGSSQANEAQPQNQTVRFSDVHGCEEAKEELQELVEFLKNPDKFSSLGGKLPKGVLLTGPPGTGKTLLARAVAGEAGVPFFFASGSEFDEMYVGVGAKRIRELFNNARAKAPAIIFIDELDAIGSKRVDRDPAYVKQSLNQLLTELDGFSQETGVIIIAATNLPKLLDKALTRPGRFDRNVVVPLPDVRGRAAILKHHMKKVQIAPDVDETVIARSTTGFSGADLENLVNQAAVRASRNKATMVTTADLDWSKDKIMLGAERRSAVIKDKDKLKTAYHESGHALVGLYTKNADQMYKVTIIPRGPTLGVTYYLPEMDRVSMAKNQMLAQIDVSLGGKLAEEIVYGEDSVTTGCSSDLSKATRTAYAMITKAGMSKTMGDIDLSSRYERLSAETRSNIEVEVREILTNSRQRATEILNTHRKELDLLANALIEYETLTRDEMLKVIKGEKLPRLATVKKSAIKLPEIKLPPGMGVTTPAEPGQSGSTPGSASSSGGSSPPPESGEGGVKM